MKITKMKKSPLLLFLLGATMLIQPSIRAEIGLGEVWGTAWTIGDIIIGETTLTPAYAVQNYYLYQKTAGWSNMVDQCSTEKVNRDLLGHYFYYQKFIAGGSTQESTDPFPVYSMNKLNMTCKGDLGGGQIVTTTVVQTHKEWVWMARVEQTGLWPDDGPWTVWLKTVGYKTGCNRPPPQSDYYFWVPASIGKSGGQTVSLGTPNAILNYPFYLAHEFYK